MDPQGVDEERIALQNPTQKIDLEVDLALLAQAPRRGLGRRAFRGRIARTIQGCGHRSVLPPDRVIHSRAHDAQDSRKVTQSTRRQSAFYEENSSESDLLDKMQRQLQMTVAALTPHDAIVACRSERTKRANSTRSDRAIHPMQSFIQRS